MWSRRHEGLCDRLGALGRGLCGAAVFAIAAAGWRPAAGAEAPAIRFREVAVEWGIDFRHRHGGSGERYMVETVVGGAVLFDYDQDGDVDALFVDGGRLPGYEGPEPGSRLYRNDPTAGGRPRFVDVTPRSGIDTADFYGSGGTAGDVDGDGDLDLYLTAFGANRLYRNRGDGSFEEVGAAAGVADPLWSASAAFSDVDRDGDLDLYVTNYVDFRLDNHKFCGRQGFDIRGYCAPGMYEGEPDRFYRNRGDGTFRDETAEAGFSGAVEAGLGVVFGDLDGDGWPDLYVANDADPNFFYRNRGDGTFEDASLISGTALDENGRAEGGMGVDIGDVDNDGRPDIFVTNFEFESNALYQNAGGGLFVDKRYAFRLAEASLHYLAFGTVLADLDHDADLDLVVGNGHILDNAAVFNELSAYAQPNQVFENLGDGTFRELEGHGLDTVRVTRGLAAGDLDGDGDLDLTIVNSNDLAEVWENVGEAAEGGWVMVDLAAPDGNRSGVDATITLTAGARRQLRQVRTASSYLSQNPLTVHFGLGASIGEEARAESLEIVWPDGRRQRLDDLPAGRRYRVARTWFEAQR